MSEEAPVEEEARGAQGQERRLLVALLLAVGLYRLALLGKGAQSLPDELVYYQALEAVGALLQGDLRGFASHVNWAYFARPGEILLRLPGAALQLGLHRLTGLHPVSPPSLLIPAVWNVLVSLLGTWAFHGLTRRLLGDARVALLAAGVQAAMASSNFYLRHLFPYDASLTLALLALWTGATARGPRTQVAAGALAAASFTVYPGYYPVVVGCASLVVLGGPRLRWRDLLDRGLGFGLGAALVLGAAEGLAGSAGLSYWRSLTDLSGSVRLGAFAEGYRFLPVHLWTLEGPLALALLAGAALWLGRWALGAIPRGGPLPALLLALLGMWAWHATSSAVLERMVFYGRTVRLYYPFLVLACAALLSGLPAPRARRAGWALLLVLTALSWLRFTISYGPLAYPRDVLWRERVWVLQVPEAHRVAELPPYGPLLSPPGPPGHYRDSRALLLLNCCLFDVPLRPGQERTFTPPPGARPRFEGTHYLSHPGYGFEGWDPEARSVLRERPWRLAVYELPGP